MSASYEYTEWHLTDAGWVRGTTKTDSAFHHLERPADAIATFVYSEEISYFGPVDEKIKRQWVCDGVEDEVARTILIFGNCPRSL